MRQTTGPRIVGEAALRRRWLPADKVIVIATAIAIAIATVIIIVIVIVIVIVTKLSTFLSLQS